MRPLFNQDAEKAYNLNKAFQLQRPVRRQAEEDIEEQIDFDEEAWERDQERLRREKLKRYEESMTCLLEQAVRAENREITLEQAAAQTREDEEMRGRLIPNVEIFKEIMVELIKNREMEIDVLKKERSQFIQDRQGEFQINEMLLQIVEENPGLGDVERICVSRLEHGGAVTFPGILNEHGERKDIRCSNVRISVYFKEG